MSGTARRVVRGGSWNDVQGYARASYRYDYAPGLRFDGVGLRVVRSSPSLA
jgi:formylglycine-generating enzyme required for sulfatase activity